MNKVQQNNLEKAFETFEMLGIKRNFKEEDQEIIAKMVAKKLHPICVIKTYARDGSLVFTDYPYLSEEDDLTVKGFVEFLENLKQGYVYSNCISPYNFGMGELGTIRVQMQGGKLVRIG